MIFIENILKFYCLANTLKYKLRQGWVQINLSSERQESIAEHIYGTLILAISIVYEYKLDIDLYKVLKMLTLHELEEIKIGDLTIRDNITKQEKNKLGEIAVHEITNGLISQEEIENLIHEFNDRTTKEAKFCYLIDKIECDFQAKIYDLLGYMNYDEVKKDLDYYTDYDAKLEALKAKNASDIWLLYDKHLYKDNDIFIKLLDNIKNLDIKKYNEYIESEDNYVR